MIDSLGPTPFPFESTEFCETTSKDRFGFEPSPGVDAFELLLDDDRGLINLTCVNQQALNLKIYLGGVPVAPARLGPEKAAFIAIP